PDGEVKVRVTRTVQRITVDIRDTGCGMDPAFVRERLFKPFYSTKHGNGMGIGAFEARELVRSLGGEVEVHSRVGEGTSFRMHFPSNVFVEDQTPARLSVVK
nr:hypothetical protein [Gammaproteobacteria bacterium]NIR88808.1 hypothetical protein [Gammaproteobacteria bacterium]NIU06421.1 hypothetical protein [Gammaproteobacteria bacterium]NIV53313.1 hypothetical protein [Gammaproteobacteria bacterium]NIX87694.1 hypothetical protein [Gammaproteobacteria bacterium]